MSSESRPDPYEFHSFCKLGINGGPNIGEGNQVLMQSVRLVDQMSSESSPDPYDFHSLCPPWATEQKFGGARGVGW